MHKCYILDLDGTLVSSIYAIQKSVNSTLGYWNMCEISVEKSRFYVGDGYKEPLKQSLTAYGDKELAHYDEIVDWYQNIFRKCCIYHMEAYKSIREFLEFLRSQGILITVLPNKPYPRALDNVESVFGKGYFNLVYGEREDKGIRKKPCSDGVQAIAEELGLSESEVLYLGDTSADVETGGNAKVGTVGMTWGFRTKGEFMAFHPAFIADHPSRVIQYIKDVSGIE